MTDGGAGLAERVTAARRVVVLTGAGSRPRAGCRRFGGRRPVAAVPGRGPGDPRGVPARSAPGLGWYNWRRQLVARCAPNPAHFAIAHLERRAPEFLLITQTWTACTGWREVSGWWSCTATSGASGARRREPRGICWTSRCRRSRPAARAEGCSGPTWSGSARRCRRRRWSGRCKRPAPAICPGRRDLRRRPAGRVPAGRRKGARGHRDRGEHGAHPSHRGRPRIPPRQSR